MQSDDQGQDVYKTKGPLKIKDPHYISVRSIDPALGLEDQFAQPLRRREPSATSPGKIADGITSGIITHIVTYPAKQLNGCYNPVDYDCHVLVSATIKSGAATIQSTNYKNLLIDLPNRKLYVRISYRDLVRGPYAHPKQCGMTVTRNNCRIEFYADISQHYDKLPAFEPTFMHSR